MKKFELQESSPESIIDSLIDIDDVIIETSEYLTDKEDTININDLIIETAEYANSKDGNIDITDIIKESGLYEISKVQLNEKI